MILSGNYKKGRDRGSDGVTFPTLPYPRAVPDSQ